MPTEDKELFRCAVIHGIPVNDSNIPQSLEEIQYLIDHDKKGYVCFFEANLFSRSSAEKDVREVIRDAALIYPDGISPAFAASAATGKKFQRVSGPTFILNACQYGLDKNWRHFFYGGGPGVAEKLAKTLSEKYPGLQVAGTYCPPFRSLTEEEEKEVKNKIESGGTTLLWVGLGGPKQEFWMRAHQEKINVPVMFGVGAAFDFHTGNRPWAPKFIRIIGLEWLWRMFSGGKSTFFRNVKCISRVLLILLGDSFKYKLKIAKREKIFSRLP